MRERFMKNRIPILLFTFLIICTITFVITYGELRNNVVDLTNTNLSGVNGNVVYINDVESDYYYYTVVMEHFQLEIIKIFIQIRT